MEIAPCQHFIQCLAVQRILVLLSYGIGSPSLSNRADPSERRQNELDRRKQIEIVLLCTNLMECIYDMTFLGCNGRSWKLWFAKNSIPFGLRRTSGFDGSAPGKEPSCTRIHHWVPQASYFSGDPHWGASNPNERSRGFTYMSTSRGSSSCSGKKTPALEGKNRSSRKRK